PRSSLVIRLISRALLNKSIYATFRQIAMANPAAVERRARVLVMSSMAMYASAVENQRRSRRRLLMVGAIVAKLASARRSGLRRRAFGAGKQEQTCRNSSFDNSPSMTYQISFAETAGPMF